MRKILALILCFVSLFSLVACATKGALDSAVLEFDSLHQTNNEAGGASQKAYNWVTDKINDDRLFSFKYNGTDFKTLLNNGTLTKKVSSPSTVDGNKTKWTLTYTVTAANASIWADIVYDPDFDSVDWICYCKNSGSANTKQFSDILPLNSAWTISSPTLYTANGSSTEPTDFQTITKSLSTNGDTYTMKTGDGRSAYGAFPFFDISNGTTGVIGAIGWTGDWQATFTRSGTIVNMQAGMQKGNFYLVPGEQLRLPSIVMMFFDGTQDEGHNKWRRMLLNDYMPKQDNGQPLTELPAFMNTWGGLGNEEILHQIDVAERVGFKYDALWIDAGWYCDRVNYDSGDGLWYSQLGNWDPHPNLYPNDGFKAISEKLKSLGKGLLVWFEPERAMPGTKIVTQYPSYFLKKPSGTNFYIYNFADDTAANFMTNQIVSILRDNGITWYRQDFNCSPAKTWAYNDATNRQGVTEIKYITNLYKFLDAIRAAGVMIDNCASGGRRIDIEMMKRSVPLWRSDYSIVGGGSIPDGVRTAAYCLSWWVPLSGGGASSEGRLTNYDWRTSFGAAMVCGFASIRTNFYTSGPEEYFSIRKYQSGDYYILAQGLGDNLLTTHAAYEFFRSDLNEGIFLAFFPQNSAKTTKTYKLKGLNASTTYRVTVKDTGKTFTATGKELMEIGLTVTNTRVKTSLLVTFVPV